jgi:hypothetical protein
LIVIFPFGAMFNLSIAFITPVFDVKNFIPFKPETKFIALSLS